MAPKAQDLVAAVQADGPGVLDKWAPWIDELTDMEGASAFFGGTPSARTIARSRGRLRADGKPEWPPPDRVFGRSPAWRYRTLVVHRAASPGQAWAAGKQVGRANNPTGAGGFPRKAG